MKEVWQWDEKSKYMNEKKSKYSITVEAVIYGWRQQTTMIHDRNVREPK